MYATTRPVASDCLVTIMPVCRTCRLAWSRRAGEVYGVNSGNGGLNQTAPKITHYDDR